MLQNTDICRKTFQSRLPINPGLGLAMVGHPMDVVSARRWLSGGKTMRTIVSK